MLYKVTLFCSLWNFYLFRKRALQNFAHLGTPKGLQGFIQQYLGTNHANFQLPKVADSADIDISIWTMIFSCIYAKYSNDKFSCSDYHIWPRELKFWQKIVVSGMKKTRLSIFRIFEKISIFFSKNGFRGKIRPTRQLALGKFVLTSEYLWAS